MASPNTAKLTVTLSRETDLALRAYLGAQGLRKGGLSKFIEEAVQWRMFDQTVQEIKARNANTDPEELQAIIDEACAAVRAEMFPPAAKPK